jgi:hypothetical protein
MWLWIKELPASTHPIFTARIGARTMMTFSLRGDGKLELGTSSNREVGVFRKSNVYRMRWTHITLVHYPHRASNPTIREHLIPFHFTATTVVRKKRDFGSFLELWLNN